MAEGMGEGKETDRPDQNKRACARGAFPSGGQSRGGPREQMQREPFFTAGDGRRAPPPPRGHGWARAGSWLACGARRGAATCPAAADGRARGLGQASYAYFHPADMYEVNRAHYGILTQVRARRAGTLRQWSS